MILRHLRHLTAIAEHGSIARAAAALRLAQPALSRELRQLELTLGVTLVERERRGVRLTGAGTALVADAGQILVRLAGALVAAREAHEGRRGTVRIGLGRIALDSPRVGRAYAAVRQRYPGLTITIGQVSPFTGSGALRARQFDLAIGTYLAADSRGLRTELLYENRADAVLLASSHPLARAASLALSDLRGHLCLGVAAAYEHCCPRLREELRAGGIERVESHTTLESVYSLVAAGRGWCVATREQRAHPPPHTVAVPLRGLDLPMPTYVRWRAHDASRACQNVVVALMEALSDDRAARSRAPLVAAERRRRRSRTKSPGLELRQLEAFVATVDERSLSRAAERLEITQSGVSRRLSALEREVGCPLLDRVPGGVEPSAAGQLFGDEARALLRLTREAVLRARLLGGGEPPSCRIGVLPQELTGGLQVQALRRLVEVFPEARFDVAEMLPDQQMLALRERRIDVAISGGVRAWRPPAGLSSVLLTEDPVDCVMVASNHAWAARAWVTAADLAEEPFVFVERGDAQRTFDAVMRGFAEIGLTPAFGPTAGGARAVWRCVADGLGWTIGSRSLRSNPPRGLAPVPVEGLHISWGIALLWRRDESDPLVRQVLDVFRETRNPDVPVVVATVRAAYGPASVTAG